MQEYQQILNRVSGYTVHKKKMGGREQIVVPVTMLVEGVHCGSGGCLYYSKELLKQTALQWNDIPVTITHPDEPCNSPKIVDEYVVGRVYNANVKGDKLKAEIYFDMQLLLEKDPLLFERVKASDNIEVSTGLHPLETVEGGIWKNEQYDAAILDMRPDHLAILPNECGACSIQDGCGIRNKEGIILNDNKKIIPLSFADDSLLNKKKKSLSDTCDKVQKKIWTMDNEMSWHNVVDIYPNYVVFERRPAPQAIGGTSHLFKADYTIDDSGTVLLSEPMEVKQEVKYTPLKNEKEGEVIVIEEIKNDCGCKKTPEVVDTKPAEVTPPQAPPVENKSEPVTMDSFLKNAPLEIRNVLQDGVRMYEGKKTTLIKNILSADGNQFTEVDLSGADLSTLEKINGLIPKPQANFIGNAGVVDNTVSAEPPLAIPSMADMFPRKGAN